MKLHTLFAETLVTIDVARIIQQQIDFDSFINEHDHLCWVALSDGDVVPSLYIEMIDQAFGELSDCHKGKYYEAYHGAVKHYEKEKGVNDLTELYFSSEMEDIDCIDNQFNNDCPF